MKAEKYNVEEVALLGALVLPVIPELGLSHLFICYIIANWKKGVHLYSALSSVQYLLEVTVALQILRHLILK